MERFKKFAAPALCAFLILLVTFLLKSAHSSKLWKAYTLLSVPAQTDASLVDKVLAEQNCSGCVTLEGQAKKYSSGYEKRKSLYFFDKEKNYKLCYVPDSSAKAAERAVQILQSNFHVNAFLGSKASFSYFPLLVCLLAFLVFLRFAENKKIFSLAAAPGLFYSFCNPFYAAAAAVCLELYALFLAQKLWRRKGAAKALAQNFYMALFFAAAFAVSFSAGFKRGILFALNILCSLSLLLLFFNWEIQQEKSARFLPVYIRSAKRVAAMSLWFTIPSNSPVFANAPPSQRMGISETRTSADDCPSRKTAPWSGTTMTSRLSHNGKAFRLSTKIPRQESV